MSELRQRRGADQNSGTKPCENCGHELAADAAFCSKCGTKQSGAQATAETKVEKTMPPEKTPQLAAEREETIQKISDMVEQIQAGPKPGISAEAKKWKDLLKQDPNNLECMFELGLAYGAEQNWEKCANVMIRGVKRTAEFKDAQKSYDYLYALIQASLRVKKFKQATMILQEMKDAPNEEAAKQYEIVQCQVYCANADSQKGIKAFHQAIKGSDFDGACQVWAGCVTYLKMADSYDICKQAMDALAQKEADTELAQKKMSFLEQMVEVKESARETAQAKAPWWTWIKWFALFYFIFLMACLYHLEGKSLANLKIGKGGK